MDTTTRAAVEKSRNAETVARLERGIEATRMAVERGHLPRKRLRIVKRAAKSLQHALNGLNGPRAMARRARQQATTGPLPGMAASLALGECHVPEYVPSSPPVTVELIGGGKPNPDPVSFVGLDVWWRDA